MPEELHALQHRFQDYLEGKSEDFIKDIVSSENALAEHRLGAYYNAYRIRLIDCLATDFPVLRKEVGAEAFEYLVLDYLKLYPSEHPSVRWVGRHMVEFLQHSTHENRDFLAELAQFEWAQGLSFDAANSDQIFTMDAMAVIPPEQWPSMSFAFSPSTRWLDLYWNIPPYWTALDTDGKAPQKQIEEYPTRWLIWRKDLRPNWRSLEAAEAWAIEASFKGANFAELCEGLLEWFGEESVAMSAAGYLKQWIHDEIITDIIINA
ncbi:MAG: DNA-binding domain-containing protein [Gammaproteobacteria bacterium]|nr:DNA-binding domain-containing protein [Gammaproteobacteria bacterium]